MRHQERRMSLYLAPILATILLYAAVPDCRADIFLVNGDFTQHGTEYSTSIGGLYAPVGWINNSGLKIQASAAQVLTYIIGRFTSSARLPKDPESLAKLCRSTLYDRRVVLFMDNATDASQVAGLAPPPSQCLLVVTARTEFYLPGMLALDLPVMDDCLHVSILSKPPIDVSPYLYITSKPG